MKTEHSYERIIGEKLNSIEAPDVSFLWEGMQRLLDQKMPQQEGTNENSATINVAERVNR